MLRRANTVSQQNQGRVSMPFNNSKEAEGGNVPQTRENFFIYDHDSITGFSLLIEVDKTGFQGSKNGIWAENDATAV